LAQLETEGAVLSGEELWEIRRLLDQAATAYAWTRKSRREETPGLDRLLAPVEPLPALHRELGRSLEPSGEVRDDASADLARIRRSIRTLRERLAQKLESIARGLGVPETFVTLREGRYAIAVPALSGERWLRLRGARHPLLVERHARGEMSSPPVPLDLELDRETPLLLVTGPNMGGKTVALKTAGLTALLGMAGLPVPAAEGTRIPWFDHVVCDIGDEQSLMEDVSTFLSHLRRVSEAI